jgi:NADPH2:quinone reductase
MMNEIVIRKEEFKMKAILVNDDRRLRWDEVPNPVIKSEEVLVEIHAAALNRAYLIQSEGDYPPPPGCPECRGIGTCKRYYPYG